MKEDCYWLGYYQHPMHCTQWNEMEFPCALSAWTPPVKSNHFQIKSNVACQIPHKRISQRKQNTSVLSTCTSWEGIPLRSLSLDTSRQVERQKIKSNVTANVACQIIHKKSFTKKAKYLPFNFINSSVNFCALNLRKGNFIFNFDKMLWTLVVGHGKTYSEDCI